MARFSVCSDILKDKIIADFYKAKYIQFLQSKILHFFGVKILIVCNER